jgi:hypothetical protein
MAEARLFTVSGEKPWNFEGEFKVEDGKFVFRDATLYPPDPEGLEQLIFKVECQLRDHYGPGVSGRGQFIVEDFKFVFVAEKNLQS